MPDLSYKQSQFRRRRVGRSPRDGSRGVLYKQSQLPERAAARWAKGSQSPVAVVQTKPIQESCKCQVRNKPDLPRTGETASWTGDKANRAKQSQFPGRDGRPARPGFHPARVPLPRQAHKQSQFAPDGHGRPSPRPKALTMPPVTEASAPNKANLPRTGETASRASDKANRAKQSQFTGRGGLPTRPRFYPAGVPLPHPAHKQSQLAGAVAPNKANRRPAVQTKPNSGGRYTPLLHYSIIPAFQPRPRCTNKASLPRHDHESRRSDRRSEFRLQVGKTGPTRVNAVGATHASPLQTDASGGRRRMPAVPLKTQDSYPFFFLDLYVTGGV